LLNGIASHVLDFDDTHFRAIHPSAPVLPAVLAFADWRGVSGMDFVHAYVLGIEVPCHLLNFHICNTQLRLQQRPRLK
jgi:2-methylcitrate dehydratase PrpD